MADTDPAAMMRAMAARILKQPGPPPPSAPAQNTAAPRTIPRQPPPAAPVSSTTLAPSSVARPPTPSFGSVTPPPVQPSPPVVKEEVVVPNAGPSLFGTPEQLAEARRFSQEATTGGHRSRPGSASRQRATPARPSSSASDSSRASFARSSYTHSGAPPSPAASRLTPPSASDARPAPSFTAPGSSLASNGVLTPISQLQSKPDVTFGQPSTFGSTSQSSSAAAFSFTDIASPKIEKAVEPKPVPPATTSAAAPPHLRAKDWQGFTVNGAGTDQKSTAGKNDVKKEESAKTMIPSVKVEPAEPTEPDRRVKQESEESDYIVVSKAPATTVEKPKAMPAASSAQGHSVTVRAEEIARVTAEIATLTKQVAALTQRVVTLENENFQMQGKVDPMYQMEERRRYLGTNDAKAPFELSVKCPPGTYCKVQANAALKVAELIRRVRVASKTSPAESPSPRLVAEGQELGHALTLHEAGITPNSSVEFLHNGPKAYEDEEL